MPDILERARARVDDSPDWVSPVSYFCLALLAVAIESETDAIGAGYFEALAQVLPVLVLALVLDQSMLISAVPGAIEAMRGDLQRRIEEESRPNAADALGEGANEVERRAAMLPQTLLASGSEITRALALFASAEAVALYAMASERYTWPNAVYCALAAAWVVRELIISVRARAIGEGAVAQIRIVEILEGRGGAPKSASDDAGGS